MTKEKAKEWYRNAALLGMVLGLICHFLPPQYHEMCKYVARACTGEF